MVEQYVDRGINPETLDLTPKVTITESTFLADQMGLTADTDIRPGEVLFRVTGPKIPDPTKYSFQYSRDLHIEPENNGEPGYGHFLNHGCDPNVHVVVIPDNGHNGHIDIVARREIHAGQEIAIDYATMEFDPTISGLPCECGSELCRSVITGFKDLDPQVKQQYINEGIIPQYLIDLDSK